jgi:hypothetical protein
MANQDLPAPADLVHDYCNDVLDLLKVVFIAVAPPVIMFLGAVVAVDAARELNDTIAKIKEPIDKATIEEFKEKLRRFLWIWPLIPALQLCIAVFAHIAGSVSSERAGSVAVLAYIAGFFASLIAYTLYEPYFALFTEFWRRLTELTYLGSVALTYFNAFKRLVYK